MNFDLMIGPKPEVPTLDSSALLLNHVLYIHHSLSFKKDQAKVQALVDFCNQVKAMTPAYTAKLGFKVKPINIRAQKIDRTIFQTFEMVLATFQVKDEFKKTQFFQETFF